MFYFFHGDDLGIFQAIIYPAETGASGFCQNSFNGRFILGTLFSSNNGCGPGSHWEEVYFRGFLYPALRQHFGAAKGIIITALFFSCMHFDLYRLIPIAAGGIGLTYLYERSGNIWTNIIAHGVWMLL